MAIPDSSRKKDYRERHHKPKNCEETIKWRPEGRASVNVSKVCVRNAKREHEHGEELRIFRKEVLEDVHRAPYSTLKHSLQLGVLCLGFRTGMSGVCVFPDGEEVFVGGERPDASASAATKLAESSLSIRAIHSALSARNYSRSEHPLRTLRWLATP
jgi:hypothetical protein